MSASKQTAGVEFIGLSDESRRFINTWISSVASPNTSEAENTNSGAVTSWKSAFNSDETADETSIPETAKTDIVVEELVQAFIAEELAAMLPSVETKDGPGESQNARGEKQARALEENVSPTNRLELTLGPQGVRSEGERTDNVLPGVAPQPRRYLGSVVSLALLLSILISPGYYLRKVANGRPHEKATSSEDSSTSSMVAPHKPGVPSDAGFILQVAAMEEEKNAISFADLLRQRGFSSYVFKPVGSKLYRVLVGPYSDADSAVKVEHELRKQGFEAIRRKNTLVQ